MPRPLMFSCLTKPALFLEGPPKKDRRAVRRVIFGCPQLVLPQEVSRGFHCVVRVCKEEDSLKEGIVSAVHNEQSFSSKHARNRACLQRSSPVPTIRLILHIPHHTRRRDLFSFPPEIPDTAGTGRPAFIYRLQPPLTGVLVRRRRGSLAVFSSRHSRTPTA